MSERPRAVDPFLLRRLGEETEARAATATAPSSDADGAPQELPDDVGSAVADLEDALLAGSHDLAAHPEVAFEEHRSAAMLADLVEAQGFPVTRSAHGVETALPTSARRSAARGRPHDRDPVGVRRAAGHRARLRPQRHRHGRGGCLPGARARAGPAAGPGGLARHSRRGGRLRQGPDGTTASSTASSPRSWCTPSPTTSPSCSSAGGGSRWRRSPGLTRSPPRRSSSGSTRWTPYT